MKSIIFYLIVISAFLVACEIPAISSSESVSEREYKEVTINSIYNTYDANPVRGEKLYEDEYLRIEGYVVSIGSSDDGSRLFLRQNPPASFMGISTSTGSRIEANFRDSESDDVAELSVGNRATVECRGRGFQKENRNFVITQQEFWLDRCRLESFSIVR